MKRRIIAAVLAFCILLVCAPVPTTAAGDSIGKYAVPNPDVTEIYVWDREIDLQSPFYHEDFADGTVFYVENYYQDSQGTVWYLVSFYTGSVVGDFADAWPQEPWVRADGLEFIDLCACCEHCTGAKGCECGCESCDFCEKEEENTCACCDSCTGTEGCECVCGECDFCEKEPENTCACCDSCTGAEGCACECGACDFCEKEEEPSVPSISATVTDANGNEQTVTVSGDALPEGAELVISDAPDLGNGTETGTVLYGYNISIVVNGEEWQPSNKLSLTFDGIQIFENPYIAIDHIFDDAAAIGRGEGFAFDDPEIVALFPKEEEIAFEATGLSDVIYVETFSNNAGTVTINSDGTVSVEVGSFSTYYILSGSSATAYSNTANSRTLPSECDAGSEPTWYIRESSSDQTFYFHGESSLTSQRKTWVLRENTASATISVSDKNWISDIYRYANVTIPSSAKAGTSVTVRAWATGYAGGIKLQVYGKYTISYDANGGTGAPASHQDWPYDTSSNPPISSTVPTRTGYTFLGWVDANGKIWSGGTAYTGDTDLKLTAMWGKQSSVTSGWNKNFYILPGATSASFANALKYIDVDATNNSIKGDCNTYYIAPGTTVALAHDSGMWRIDGAKSGLSLKAGSATAGAGSWTAASPNATLTVSASAAEGTTMMIYVRDAAEPAEVSCARIIVDKVSDITANATNDTQGIYRVGLFVICDSTKIPGEPNYTTDIDMTNYQNIGMAYKSKGSDVIDPSIGSSAHYISSIDGSCTMGVVDYTGYETVNFVTQTLLDDAMQTVIDAITSGSKTMIAADGTNLNQYYTEHGGANGGAEAIRANFSVRPHIAKLMTGLGFSDLGWHVDCSIYPLQTISLTYNLNLPTGYILKTVGTPAPGIFTGDLDVEEAVFTVPAKPELNSVYSATVTGATDTVSLTFVGWNTKADGTGETYVPGSPITIESDTILYAKWSGGEFNTGTLEIYKEVSTVENSDEPSNGDTFAFEINLGGSYAYTVYAASTGAKLRSGTMTNGTFTLQDGQFIRFTGVPKAKYTIKETSLPVHYSIETATQEINLVGGYVNKVTFTNEYSNIPSFTITGTIDNGTVNGTVQKGSQSVLRGSSSAEMVFMPNEGYEISSITVDDSSITVTEALKKGYTYPVQNNVTAAHTVVVTTIKKTYTVNVVADSGVDVGETYPWTVEHGENITITFAPKSGYEIQRVDVDGQSYGTTIEQGILKLEIKKDTTVTITSVCTLGDLTIQKTGDNIDPNQVFIFEVTCGDDFKLQVPVKGKGSVTIYQLKAGTYTVTEITTWSWRYTPNQQSQTVTISGGDITTVTFNNSRTNNDWLSAFYNIINAKGS